MSEPVWSVREGAREERVGATSAEQVGLVLSLVGVLFLLGPMMLAPFGLAFSVGGPVVARRGRSGVGTAAVIVGVVATLALLGALAVTWL
jgi:hypothetical protein